MRNEHSRFSDRPDLHYLNLLNNKDIKLNNIFKTAPPNGAILFCTAADLSFCCSRVCSNNEKILNYQQKVSSSKLWLKFSFLKALMKIQFQMSG